LEPPSDLIKPFVRRVINCARHCRLSMTVWHRSACEGQPSRNHARSSLRHLYKNCVVCLRHANHFAETYQTECSKLRPLFSMFTKRLYYGNSRRPAKVYCMPFGVDPRTKSQPMSNLMSNQFGMCRTPHACQKTEKPSLHKANLKLSFVEGHSTGHASVLPGMSALLWESATAPLDNDRGSICTRCAALSHGPAFRKRRKKAANI